MKYICRARMPNSKLRSAIADMGVSSFSFLVNRPATAIAREDSRRGGWSARACSQAGHEGGVFRGRQPLAKHLRHALALELQQRGRVQPETGKDLGAQDAVAPRWQI